MLDAGVVDQDVDATELQLGCRHQRLDLGRSTHVGAMETDLAAVRGDLGTRAIDVAKPIEHHIRTLARQRVGDGKSDAAG